jgi:hypothetical protein
MRNATLERTVSQEEVEYQKYTWQAIEKLAKAIGVPYYKDKDRHWRLGNGRGFGRSSHDATFIPFQGGIDVYGDNDYTKQCAYRYHKEAFFLKIELYCLKNNLKYVLVEMNHPTVRSEVVYAGMRIIKNTGGVNE